MTIIRANPMFICKNWSWTLKTLVPFHCQKQVVEELNLHPHHITWCLCATKALMAADAKSQNDLYFF